jgi:mycothiol synthase
MSYTWRSLEVADIRRWSELTKIVSDADDLDEAYSAEDLAEELDDPTIDVRHDTVAVHDADGTLVAVGQVMAPMLRGDGAIRVSFSGLVHPVYRGRGIGSELIGRLDRRARERAAQQRPGAAVRLSTHVGSGVRDARALLEVCGYHAARYFHALGRRLDHVAAAADARVQAYAAARDAEVHAAHVEAFSTHWGYARPDDAQWRSWFTGSRTFRPAYSMLGLGPDGSIDGYVLTYQYQPGELYIGQLGVRPAARGRGLARAMLLRTLAVAAEHFDVVKLHVDSENADGAGRLYESMGFTKLRSSVIYERVRE